MRLDRIAARSLAVIKMPLTCWQTTGVLLRTRTIRRTTRGSRTLPPVAAATRTTIIRTIRTVSVVFEGLNKIKRSAGRDINSQLFISTRVAEVLMYSCCAESTPPGRVIELADLLQAYRDLNLRPSLRKGQCYVKTTPDKISI